MSVYSKILSGVCVALVAGGCAVEAGDALEEGNSAIVGGSVASFEMKASNVRVSLWEDGFTDSGTVSNHGLNDFALEILEAPVELDYDEANPNAYWKIQYNIRKAGLNGRNHLAEHSFSDEIIGSPRLRSFFSMEPSSMQDLLLKQKHKSDPNAELEDLFCSNQNSGYYMPESLTLRPYANLHKTSWSAEIRYAVDSRYFPGVTTQKNCQVNDPSTYVTVTINIEQALNTEINKAFE